MDRLNHCWVIVSGVAASGKSTVGRAIARSLGGPFLDKDDFLKALFAVRPQVDSELRQRLSRLADHPFRAQAEREAPRLIRP